MVNYTCTICTKEFSKKSHYIDHTEKRKNPCQPNIIIQLPNTPKALQTLITCQETGKNSQVNCCNQCGIIFSKKSNLNRHIKNNICNKKENDTTSLKKEIQTYKKEIEELKKLFYELSEKQKKEAKQSINNQNNTNIETLNNTQNIQNNNINIILPHGKELEKI